MPRNSIRTLLALGLLASATREAHAQFAVIDVASLTQLIAEVRTLEEQLATARSQLGAARAEFQSITGPRGMEQLLAGTPRNYLPADWTTLASLAGGPGRAHAALGAELRGALAANSLLSAAQLAALPAAAAAQLEGQRRTAALRETLTHAALANSSSRFAALEQLIGAIGRANDQKAVLDLTARIGAETGMLENEHTKLEALYEGLHADDLAHAQRTRELTIAGHGQFDSRFRPHP